MLTSDDLRAWSQRLSLSEEGRAAIDRVRCSPPSRLVGGGRNNVSGRYPSKKMGAMIQFESHRVELPTIYELEHDPDVLEFYDQPPPIELRYESKRGRRLIVSHTSDFFVLRKEAAGWEECKTEEGLVKLADDAPHRYQHTENGRWRCPPGEAYAAPRGLYYRFRSSQKIDWGLQRNLQFLDDYFRGERVPVSPDAEQAVRAQLRTEPGITLAALVRKTEGAATQDDIHFLIAREEIYVGLSAAFLGEPDTVRVFVSKETAVAYGRVVSPHPGPAPAGCPYLDLRVGGALVWDGRVRKIVNVGQTTISLLGDDSHVVDLSEAQLEALVRDGRISPVPEASDARPHEEVLQRLQAADDRTLAVANRRDRILRGQVGGDPPPNEPQVPERTLRRWKAWFRQAEAHYGNGFVGLLPRTRQRGNRTPRLSEEVKALLEEAILTDYETLKQKTRYACWQALKLRCNAQKVVAPSYPTFCEAVKKRPQLLKTRKRQGRRAAYAHEVPYLYLDQTTPRHGDRPFEIGHIDHTQLDLECVSADDGTGLGRPWLTLFTDAYSRRVLAFYLSYDRPSSRACMMVVRECVRRHRRLPQIVVVDGGAEFGGNYFEGLLTMFQILKKVRPPSKARFGSVCERMFGTTNTQFLYNLAGNTQLTRRPRQVTKSTNPKKHAVWSLGELYERLDEYLYEVFDTLSHPALGQSPREAFTTGQAQSGLRSHRLIPYDETFLLLTLPLTAKGTAKVMPGRGVKINHLYYWAEVFRDPEVEGQSVPVRYDPFDAGLAHAFVRGRWQRCHSEYYHVFQGRTEQEVRLATKTLLAMRRQYAQDRAITAKRLAELVQSVEVQEQQLIQRRRDQESLRIRGVSTGAVSAPVPPRPAASPQTSGRAAAGDAPEPETPAPDRKPYGRF
ncbi:integrase [Candidatus Methylomirabilis limnetica]|uniref:Integrase n=1 Tax=Candidatus Methylomirabilis limnetica TaxID=2033718 RepID=A0A2T4TW04_9BACT|nr:Mu transposase C-terminal domain-containing protein [Candidatus Methylomirabilis limnetica]PTL35292.1 integrase [Candidatus Methylomirabilis limnetica]